MPPPFEPTNIREVPGSMAKGIELVGLGIVKLKGIGDQSLDYLTHRTRRKDAAPSDQAQWTLCGPQPSSRQTTRRTILISASRVTLMPCLSRADGFCVSASMYSFLPHRLQLILPPTNSASMSPKISFRSLGRYHRLTLHRPHRTSTSCPISWALPSFHSPPRLRLPPVSAIAPK